jgi:hypothetical protein
MPERELLAAGEGDYRLHDPDDLRAWMRDRTRPSFVDQTTAAAKAGWPPGRRPAMGHVVDFSSYGVLGAAR